MTDEHEHDTDDETGEDAPAAAPAPFSGDVSPEDEPEAEAEAEREHEAAEQGTTPEEWEARFKYAERLFETYAKKVEAKWGDDALSLVRFNLDGGAPMGYIDARNKGRADDDTRQVALAFLGMESEVAVPDDPERKACPTCQGWGVTKTGSRVPNHDVETCLNCRGIGWLGPQAPALTPGQPVAAETNDTNGVTVPAQLAPESPEVTALRLRGYTVIEPMTFGG